MAKEEQVYIQGNTLWWSYAPDSGFAVPLKDLKSYYTDKSDHKNFDAIVRRIVKWSKKNKPLKMSKSKSRLLYKIPVYESGRLVGYDASKLSIWGGIEKPKTYYYMVIIEEQDYHIIHFFKTKGEALWWIKENIGENKMNESFNKNRTFYIHDESGSLMQKVRGYDKALKTIKSLSYPAQLNIDKGKTFELIYAHIPKGKKLIPSQMMNSMQQNNTKPNTEYINKLEENKMTKIQRWVDKASASRDGSEPKGYSIYVRSAGYPAKELPKLYKTKTEAERALKKLGENKMNESNETNVAKNMKQKGYKFAIVFDKKDKLDNLYTKTEKEAMELMRTDFKDKKNYKIVPIDKIIGENKMKITKSELKEMILEILSEESGDQEEYRKFFKAACQKFGFEPEELDKQTDEKKKELFNYVDKNWKADKETDVDEELEPVSQAAGQPDYNPTKRVKAKKRDQILASESLEKKIRRIIREELKFVMFDEVPGTTSRKVAKKRIRMTGNNKDMV